MHGQCVQYLPGSRESIQCNAAQGFMVVSQSSSGMDKGMHCHSVCTSMANAWRQAHDHCMQRILSCTCKTLEASLQLESATAMKKDSSMSKDRVTVCRNPTQTLRKRGGITSWKGGVTDFVGMQSWWTAGFALACPEWSTAMGRHEQRPRCAAAAEAHSS
jgi:hypothetical protein